jgi:hypothetical protein
MTRINTPDIHKIASHFDSSKVSVYRSSDLAALQLEHSEDWNVPANMGRETFRKWLLQESALIEIKLKSRFYPHLTRYTWGDNVPPVSIALSIKPFSYCSHGTALWVNGLGGMADQIFVNAEQAEKSSERPILTQVGIDRAFRNQQRMSKLIYSIKGVRITLLSGKQSGRLDVHPANTPLGNPVEVTSVERTLIDVTVRPGYAHGPASVLRAFQLARGMISVRKMCNLLQKLDYTYPYHQAIGFYLKRAGYPSSDCRMLARFGKEFDFYLCHGLRSPAFDPEWKIFIPNEF